MSSFDQNIYKDNGMMIDEEKGNSVDSKQHNKSFYIKKTKHASIGLDSKNLNILKKN